MVEIVIYILIFLLSLVVVAVSVYSSGLEGNIVHMENGREPDAGVSLIWYVLLPPFFMGIGYIGNLVLNNLGWLIVFSLFLLIAVYSAISIPKQSRKYKALLKQRESN